MIQSQVNHSFSDAALTNAVNDRFRRAPFAKAIAATLVSLNDESSIAIGIYGPWGDGKTTVLSFIEESLKNNDRVITLSFNPWRFGDEDKLLLSFFQALADALSASLSSVKSVINKWKDALKVLPYVGGAAESLAGKLTYQDLEEFKAKTAEILQEAGKRIVVLMDDIDRLEIKEIQAVFRLVKLTASFNYVAYVLAFDNNVVAAALQEKYGSVAQSGQGFLEKIIQVPLHLPKIPTTVLLDFCQSCVAKVLSALGVVLSREEERDFEDNLALLSTNMHTPRQCKRYANGAAFALGILKGEVNPVDLLLLEALRIFHSRLYEVIRSHRDNFVAGGQLEAHDPKQFDTELLKPALAGLHGQESEAVRKLLRRLFPEYTLDAMHRSAAGLYDGYADRQRCASKHYFDRYFTYAIPAGEIADTAIVTLLTGIEKRPVERIAAQIEDMITHSGPGGADALIFRLGLRQELLDPIVSPNLARGLAAVSGNFAYQHGDRWPFMHFSEAVMLVRQLILNTDVSFGRKTLVSDIVQTGASLPFAYCCLEAAAESRTDQKPWWSVYGSLDHANVSQPPISEPEYREIGRLLAARIEKYFTQGASFELAQLGPSKLLAGAWVRVTTPQKVRDSFNAMIQANPRYALGMIRWYVSDPDTAEILGRDRYEAIVNLASADVLRAALEREFPPSMDKVEGHDPSWKLARAFFALHQQHSAQR